MSNSNKSYEVPIIFAFSETMFANVSDKVKGYRYEALKRISQTMNYYASLNYDDKILYPIAEKKCEFVKEIFHKSDIEKMIDFYAPTYDGARFIPGKYHIPQEEMIAWSQTSLSGPLNNIGTKRYLELVKEFYPEHKEMLEHLM